MKNGDIIKYKYGSETNQEFVVIISVETMNGIIIFDNIIGGAVGDTTIGYSLDDYEQTTYIEFANFLKYNNINI